MSRKEELEDRVNLAAMGKQVLNNKAYQTFFTARKAHIFGVFCDTTKDQGDVREEAWRTMVNLTALEKYFNDSLTTGKMAEVELKEENMLTSAKGK
jgi:hypothetical protein